MINIQELVEKLLVILAMPEEEKEERTAAMEAEFEALDSKELPVELQVEFLEGVVEGLRKVEELSEFQQAALSKAEQLLFIANLMDAYDKVQEDSAAEDEAKDSESKADVVAEDAAEVGSAEAETPEVEAEEGKVSTEEA